VKGIANFPLRTLGCAGIICLLGSTGALADVILTGQSVTVAAGSSNNAVEIDLTNSGPTDITVAAFSFGVQISDSDVSFTDVTTGTTSTYIFAGNSLFGPDLTGPTSGQSVIASDVFATPNKGAVLASGTTVGLGRISFDVAAGAASGSFPVNFLAFPTSSLSDPTPLDIHIDTLSPGGITILPTSVPEPSSLIPLLGCALLAVGTRGRCRKDRRRTS
jgi:hypothetical protein